VGNNVVLQGEDVCRKMLDWVKKGVIEADTAAAICNLRLSDLSLHEYVFVIMGAGAAMGPLDTLLSLGATIIALDLPVPSVWKKLLQKTKQLSNGASIIFPMAPNTTTTTNETDTSIEIVVNDKQEKQEEEESLVSRAGCNFLTQIPELIDWLVLQCPKKRLVIGQYAYLDSAAFVKVSLAMDAVASEVLRVRPDTALAYLCSPTDVFAIPTAANDASNTNFHNKQQTLSQQLLRLVFRDKRILEQNTVQTTRKTNLPLVDGLVLQQGPNYFLAKRLQHWRAMIAKYQNQTLVSSNVAPASNTPSVVKNKLLKAAFAAAHHFTPVEIFEPETSNVLMTYLLLHDLHNNNNPKQTKNQHPLELFASTPVHNGIWRCGYQIRSLLELVLAYYLFDHYHPELIATTGILIGATVLLRSRL